MKTETLIDEAAALPVEERARLAESLLASLNATDAQVDAAWSKVAQARLAELRSGQVTGVPGEAVFSRIRDRLVK
jgi:putative addiction module component (TIGR02574 family)